MFKRRIGLDPHRDGRATTAANGCPDIWELENGDFAIIGVNRTTELSPLLPSTANCGPDERLVVIPRGLLTDAKRFIPDA
jgi:hypothetical protein